MIEFVTIHAALWPVLVPMGAMALNACLSTHRVAQRAVSLIAVTLMFGTSLFLLNVIHTQGVQVVRFGGWPPPFGVVFAADALSGAMVVITGLLALGVLLFALGDISQHEEQAGFHMLLQGLLMGVNGAFLTGDLFNLYVWFEVMLIAAMGLLIVGRTPSQLDGTFKYAVLNILSTLLFLTGVAVLYGTTGTLNMADLSRAVAATGPSASLTIAAMLLLCGFGIKAGYFPLFFWLPASYHTASIAVAAIFAGLLTKVGVYASFRVFTLIFPMEGTGIREVVVVLAACTMLFGVFGAMVQWDVRRILAFHIVSQVGYMLIGLAVATPAALGGAIFYIVHHIVVKANLFLVAGAIHQSSGTYDLRKSGGLLSASPVLSALFLIPAMSLAGVPPLSGFWAKLLLIDASFRHGDVLLAAVALFVGLMTLFSMSKIWIEAFWRPAPADALTSRLQIQSIAACVLLTSVTLCLSLWPEPFIAYAENAARALLDPQAYMAAVLAPPEIGGP
ncbi:MAG: proton-conducting transporter membrane subunit [Vicinamibacterales bacterium]